MKKVLYFLLSFILIVSLAACGTTKPDAQKDTASESNVTNNLNTSGLPILNEKEEFEIYVPQMSTRIEVGKKQVVIDTEKATNVHIKWVEVPGSSWKEKINILFSTDSLPDAIIGSVDLSTKYPQLTPIDEYLVEDFAPNIVSFFNSRPEYWKILKAPDDKIYSLPTGDETYWNVIDAQTNINSHWLEAVGKDVPTTIDEFYDVLVAFKEGDPNGNGDTTDEIPFSFRGIWGWGTALENMFGPFGVLENDAHVFIRDGKAIFSPEEDGYYRALVWFNKLYREGLMDEEVFTQSWEQYDAQNDPKLDKVGAYIAYNSKKEDIYLPVVLNGDSGEPMFVLNNIEVAGGFAITNKCKNPGALVRWYDYVNSSTKNILEWNRGVEGEAWKFFQGENGKTILQLDEKAVYEKYGLEAHKKGDLRHYQAFGGTSPGFMHLGIINQWQDSYGDRPKLLLNRKIIESGWGYRSLPAGFAKPDNAERRAILLTDITAYLDKFIANSVVNGIDEASWQEHLKTLDKLKVDEYKQLVQAFVDSK
ncbi:MAG: extracellular solute-binding protein [Firmicutes bacterium]|nr:extracellular solute-binding protein [Bacillota bacterium]